MNTHSLNNIDRQLMPVMHNINYILRRIAR
jgi:hypothetical protein